MAKVYFKAIDSYSKTAEISNGAADLLKTLQEKEGVDLNAFIPLKVHVGEKGNTTFIEAKNFDGIIKFLKEKSIISAYMDTNVLYSGQRSTSENHLKLAKEHGFTQCPVIIADGDFGEDCEIIEIKKKNFTTCRVADRLAKVPQFIVLSHFKGHAIAGFGGALKQLAMGCASKGGKLAMHANGFPTVTSANCKYCRACLRVCPENAISLEPKLSIDQTKCVGCVSCTNVCKYRALTVNWQTSFSNTFLERLAEYAYAAANGKNNIYINFAFNITQSCDCEGRQMKSIAKDVGIFASLDPVAVDQACLDILDKNEGKTVFSSGRYILDYATEIGLGNKKYDLVKV